MLEGVSQMQEMAGHAALFNDAQRQTLYAQQEALSKERVRELAREKLLNLDGRLAVGEEMFVALSAGATKAQVRKSLHEKEQSLIRRKQELRAVRSKQDAYVASFQ